MTNFKVGDRVRCIESFYPINFPAGALGTVVYVSQDLTGVRVVSDDTTPYKKGYEWYVLPDELELVSEPMTNFKVGDRVRALENAVDVPVGDIGEVYSNGVSEMFLYVNFPIGGAAMRPEEIELVVPNESSDDFRQVAVELVLHWRGWAEDYLSRKGTWRERRERREFADGLRYCANALEEAIDKTDQ